MMDKGNCFLEEFKGIACIGRLPKTMAEHARALRVKVQEEGHKSFPDTSLVTVLMDAACLGAEHLDYLEEHMSVPLILRHLEDYSRGEITLAKLGEVLDQSPNVLRSVFLRASKKMAEETG